MNTRDSYMQILRSSSVMGGSVGIAMLLGMVRTKFAAVLLGPTGLGIIGSLTAIQGTVSTVTGMGMQSSAVREIAAAVGRGDEQAISRIVQGIRRFFWIFGMVGMLAVFAFSVPLSRLTFNTDAYAIDIAALGIVILLANLTAGQLALLQGMRRIDEIALANICGAALAVVAAVGFYYWLGVRGIALSILAISAIQLATTWYFARRVPVLCEGITWVQSFREVRELVKLGIVVMWTALMVAGTNYFSVLLIAREFDMNSVGLYSAAFALSGISINLVLSAMAADYYPRLVGIADDRTAVNCLINEQTEVGLLLATPGLLAALALAPWLLQFFYSHEFQAASNLLQWFVLGCLGRVISFPMGYVILGLGKRRWYLMTETFINFAHLALVAIALRVFGIDGVAMAFFMMNVGYIAIVFIVSRQLTGFTWNAKCRVLMVMAFLSCGFVFVSYRIFSTWQATVTGMAITLALGVFSLRELSHLVGSTNFIQRFIRTFPMLKFFLTRN